MATSTRLVLKPHLRERLASVAPLLEPELRGEVEAVLAQPQPAAEAESEVEAGRVASSRQSSPETDEKQLELSDASEEGGWTEVVRKERTREKAQEALAEEPEAVPPLVDAELLERLSRWAASNESTIRRAQLDPAEYSYIALLAGAAAYMPRAQARALRDAERASEKPSPYLPAHVSGAPLPSFASEYRQLMRLLSTVLNVLFSVVGCGFAAFVAATTGAGWARESAVLLALAVGAVVGVADVGIVLLYKRRMNEDAVKGARLRAREMKGSSATGVLLQRDAEGEVVKEIAVEDAERIEDAPSALTPAPKREVRLRRRAVGET